MGLYGFGFVDFGDHHSVFDANGEEPKNAIVVNVSREAEALVSVMDERRHGFQDGDWVTFREVEGMAELNQKEFQIVERSPYTFLLKGVDSTNFQPYLRQGIVEQVKKPVVFAFNSLEQSLKNPYAPEKQELDICDWEKIGRPEQLHLALSSLLELVQKNGGHLPVLNSAQDAEALLQHVKEVN